MGRYDSDSDSGYPEDGVLKNLFGIRDAQALEQLEAGVCALRPVELEKTPFPARFDLGYLRDIHRSLFSDLYEWAGELRRVNIRKGDTLFAPADRIEPAADTLFIRLAQDRRLHSQDIGVFSTAAAHYWGEIHVIHPFREGNGRTRRAFTGRLAARAGYRIDWSGIGQEEMAEASIAAYERDEDPLRRLILHRISSA